MSRRAFLKSLTALVPVLTSPATAHASIRGGTWKALQASPLARFQFHNGETLWPHFTVRPEPSKPRIREARREQETEPRTQNPLQLPLVRGRASAAPPLTRGGREGFEPDGVCSAIFCTL